MGDTLWYSAELKKGLTIVDVRGQLHFLKR